MGLVAWLDPCCSAHVSVPVDTSTVCVLCEGIDPTVVWGAVRAAEGLRHRGISSPRPAFPGFVSPAGMSIIYGTPPFSAVQSNQVGGIGRSSMPTSVPPASVTCTRGFRRRFADLLPGGGPACSPGTATRPSRTGSNGCLQTVGLPGLPGLARWGSPGPRRRDRREGPHGQRLTPRCAWESCCYR